MLSNLSGNYSISSNFTAVTLSIDLNSNSTNQKVLSITLPQHTANITASVMTEKITTKAFNQLHRLLKKGKTLLAPSFQGRLGNSLFQFVSVWAIGKMLNFTPLIIDDTEIYKSFGNQIPAIVTNEREAADVGWEFFMEENIVYDPSIIKNLDHRANKSIPRMLRVGHYFQSWRYFHPHYRKDVLKMLRIPSRVQFDAEKLIHQVKLKAYYLFSLNISANASEIEWQFAMNESQKLVKVTTKLTFIAVHLRRNDYVHYMSSKAPGFDYVEKATEYLKSKYSPVCFKEFLKSTN